MIEISGNPDSFGAVIFHSTESGRFMAASREELAGLVDAAKRGVFDAVVTGAVNSAAAWTAEQVAENEAWEHDHPEARPKPWPGA